MIELLSSAPPSAAWVVLILSVALMALPLVQPMAPRLARQAARGLRHYRVAYSLTLGVSLLLLSACGTAPLPAASCPPVPAELMTLPQEPVLLQPASPSTTRSTTTSSMPPDAVKTESGSGR